MPLKLKLDLVLGMALATQSGLNAFADETTATKASATQATAKQVKTPPENLAGSASKEVKPQIIKLAKGKLLLPVPGNWKSVKPRSRILKHEFSIPAAKGDQAPGRMTIMSAGGGIEANIARWAGQFQTTEGKQLGDDAKKVTKQKVGGLEVHIVDLTGDFQDSMRGPFGPKIKRAGYRMLAAIIPLEGGGTWFIKSYGPQATMKAVEKDFTAMVHGLKYMQ